MEKIPFKKIDAFARGTSSGNPAAVVTLNSAEELTETEMLLIAQQLKGFVSEVAYIWQRPQGGYRLRYFSSEREVAFCGHATIATMYDMIATTADLQETESITIEVNGGELQVENRVTEEDAVFITAPDPTFSQQEIEIPLLAKALGVSESAIASKRPCSIINAGLETLVVPIGSLKDILAISPDLQTLNSYCREIGIDIMILWSDEVYYTENRYRTRVFAPTFGYLEDPATGSGNAAFANYLLQENLWDGSLITIEQSDNAVAPNIIKLMREGESVTFGGGAITRIKGSYFL